MMRAPQELQGSFLSHLSLSLGWISSGDSIEDEWFTACIRHKKSMGATFQLRTRGAIDRYVLLHGPDEGRSHLRL